MLRLSLLSGLIAIFLGAGCTDPVIPPGELTLINAFPNLDLNRPVFLTHSNDAGDRVFVVEQVGIIRVFPNDSTVTDAEVFLNISGRVNDNSNERGLLGLAFHPDFATNGFFYVNYTTGDGNKRTVISRFSVVSGQADPNSEFVLLEIGQPFSNHNGGMLQFGPDGFLYVAVGDGGSGGDPNNNGQNRSTLLGTILRVDVDNPSGGLNYGIPADNPFAGNTQGFREEIFAYGLRNPWRFGIDHSSGEIWAGDVGQGEREEVDLVVNGGNYGWRIMEGFTCFNPSSNCDQTGLTLPVVDYDHGDGSCSITGGFVYRGATRPDLEGAYIYGDYCSGNIWMLRHSNGAVSEDELLLQTDLSISSFGIDEQDELYILDLDGQIYRFGSN